jgi:hypothetical protein
MCTGTSAAHHAFDAAGQQGGISCLRRPMDVLGRSGEVLIGGHRRDHRAHGGPAVPPNSAAQPRSTASMSAR